MDQLSVVGKSPIRVDALDKVTGKTKFTADFMEVGMLHAKVLRSPYPHARILGIDTSKAEKLHGVRAVMTGKDVPDRRVGMMIMDQPLIARDVVRFVGEPVAIVAADTIEIAEDALERIDVDYEELPTVFDVEKAMMPDPPVVIHPDLAEYAVVPIGGVWPRRDPERPNVFMHWKIRSGDVDKAFQEADLIVENKYSVSRVSHCMLETFRADAWVGPDGILTIRSPKQGPYLWDYAIAGYLGLPKSKVRHIEPYNGGAFGGRVTVIEDCVASLLTMKTGKPVRLILTRQEQFSACYSIVPFRIHIKDGVKRDGSLIARQITCLLDAGGYTNLTSLIVRNCTFGMTGTYRIPNFKCDNYGVYTNNFLCGPLRGFGSPEVTWAIEQQMDVIAEKLGIDPVELRKRNILKEGEISAVGEPTHSIGVGGCLDKVADAIEWGKPPVASAGPWKRAKGIAIGNKYTIAGIVGCATVKVYPDVIEVRHGVGEVGQGINTVVAQIAAEEFGVSIDKIRVVFGDTAIVPYALGAGSSNSTWHVGLALQRACRDAKRQIFDLVAPKLGAGANDLETKDWQVYVRGFPGKLMQITDLFSIVGTVPQLGEIIGRGEYTSPYIPEDPETGQSLRPATYYMHAAHAVEVAVNGVTGEVRVEKIVGCFDMGQPINPKMCEQQMDGGAIQGMGLAVYEAIVLERGVVLNPTFMDYKVPTAMETPTRENIKFFIAPAPHREGPFGAKGIGEVTLVSFTAAVGNAFFNATGVRILDLPLSREKVLKALKEAGKAQV